LDSPRRDAVNLDSGEERLSLMGWHKRPRQIALRAGLLVYITGYADGRGGQLAPADISQKDSETGMPK